MPIPHALQLIEPDASWNSPAGHAVHCDCVGSGVNVPGEHGVFVVEPVLQLEPGGQSVQSGAAARPVLLEKVPARHGSSADAP